ncbi:MDIS1-interacting receptor like kinase 2 [Iris pallida]|uniref:MDIS1-interacting receptor like kinase 2 n=1 Tax=Iris pallida TaxID=29817 RepID=A0AAX6E5F3_IRIPA|nr:MDIS1-interacting receptor like kinase 2 [Iris pallida]
MSSYAIFPSKFQTAKVSLAGGVSTLPLSSAGRRPRFSRIRYNPTARTTRSKTPRTRTTRSSSIVLLLPRCLAGGGGDAQSARPRALPHKPLLCESDADGTLRKNSVSGTGPSRSLYDTSIDDRLTTPPSEEGMEPDRLLWERSRSCSMTSFPNCDGIGPVRRLRLKSRSCCRLPRLPTWNGMLPLSWLLLRSSHRSFEQPPTSVGIVPVRLFDDRSRYSRFDILPIPLETAPVNWLLLRFSLNNEASLPSSPGISLVIWLEEKSSTPRLDSWPISGGIVPVTSFAEILKLVRLEHLPQSGETSPENLLKLRSM